MDTFKTIIEVIVLLGSAAMALTTIGNLIGKPIGIFKKQRAQKDETNKKLTELTNKIDEIKQMNEGQNSQIELLQKGQLDMLRQNILYLYNHHKDTRTLTESEHEYLEDLFTDYSNEGGNGYIAKKYNRMSKWTIVPDDDDE